MKRNWLATGAVLTAPFLFGCAGLDPETQATLTDVVNASVENGSLTPAAGQAALEGIERAADGFSMGEVGAWIGGVAAAAVTAVTGVRLQRGPSKPVDREGAAILRELIDAKRPAKG